MKLSFWGAAQEVTGSKHLLEVNGKRYLFDCGLFQGYSKDVQKKNREFLIPPSDIDELILSHAHIDHIGLLPYFVKSGFKGSVHATAATKDLCAVMLRDSAHIQELDFQYAKKKDLKDEHPYCEPLYSQDDIPDTMSRFVACNYGHEYQIDENVTIMFHDAGHVLGSAIVEIYITENGKQKKLLFSGDLGRKGLPILRDPTYIDNADYVIMESTYGSRLHGPMENMKPDVEKAINDAYKRGGKILIPAFSLERTQEMIYLLHELYDAKKIPNLPIFVDSPLSFNVTQVFKMHPEAYDKQTYETFLDNQDNPFTFGKMKFTQSVEESKALNKYEGSCIIMAASGMADAGRIRHHIANNIENEKTMIMIIGYQGEGTLGRRLVDGHTSVKIFGTEYPVNAEVRVLNSFSAHADRDEILDWFSHVKGVERIFLVHGEPKEMLPLQGNIKREFGIDLVHTPAPGKTFDLITGQKSYLQDNFKPYIPDYPPQT